MCKLHLFFILINGTLTGFFHSSIGLRQGYHFSPYKFIFYVDVLSHALQLATLSRAIDIYRSVPGALLILYLLFVDDSLYICSEYDSL